MTPGVLEPLWLILYSLTGPAGVVYSQGLIGVRRLRKNYALRPHGGASRPALRTFREGRRRCPGFNSQFPNSQSAIRNHLEGGRPCAASSDMSALGTS